MIIVSDANVIVYFWRAELLGKLLASVEIVIPEKIFVELTQNRIQRSYPDLSALMNDHRYNHQLNPSINVVMIEYPSDEHMRVHKHIEETSGLDDGEIDGIMLSIVRDNIFVTNDTEAVEYFNDVLEHETNSRAQPFEEFLDNICGQDFIDTNDVEKLIEMKNKQD